MSETVKAGDEPIVMTSIYQVHGMPNIRLNKTNDVLIDESFGDNFLHFIDEDTGRYFIIKTTTVVPVKAGITITKLDPELAADLKVMEEVLALIDAPKEN